MKQKSNKRSMTKTVLGRQKGKARKRPKDAQPEEPKERDRTSLSHGRKVFHSQPL
jgi:hypothetical protein